MSEHLHPEVHPDADSLSAFVEGVLPEHERAQCLAHLAVCSRCREIVFVIQDVPVSPAAPVLVPAPPRQLWFRPLPLLAAAAAICVVLLGAWLYMHSRTGAPPRELAAGITKAPASIPGKASETEPPKPVVRKAIPRAARRSHPEPAGEKPSSASVKAPEAPRTVPLPPSAESAGGVSASTPQVSALPPPKPAAAIQTEVAPTAVSSGIFGTVTDQTGAAVPQATVQLRQLAGNSTINARTDLAGQFKFADLAPGQYELQITAPGFRLTSQGVEVRAQQVASVKSELQVGSTAETIEVTAAASSTVQTESTSVSASSRRKRAAPLEPRPLPSKLPAEAIVTSGKVMVALDSAGALFYSGNSGKGWKAVKSKWSGKIVALVTPPEVPEARLAQFQLTTDSGSDWLSRDGRRWYPAPPKH